MCDTMYLLLYDLPREERCLLVKVNRALHALNAERWQHSVWRSPNLTGLKKIAELIREHGGEASVLEENVVF